MMLPTPRVIAIDNESKHLAGLTEGLNQCGAACLPIHFPDETENIPQCPHIRVIFADLHLTEGPATDHNKDFSTLGGLIEESIKPSGPYLIVLWTRYPKQAEHLRTYLNSLKSVTKPFAVQSLNKTKYLDDSTGGVKNPEALAKAIGEMIAGKPQVAALLAWEERISGAAGNTISSILELAEGKTAGTGQNQEIRRLLAILAVEAVGKEHVEEDRFRAVNDALLPILADRIASMRSREDDKSLWRDAFDKPSTRQNLSPDEAAKLNRLLHIALPTADSTGAERGTVIDLPNRFSGNKFKQTFGVAPNEAAQKQFRHLRIDDHDDRPRWVLVQSQAVCDYAQPKPGPLPFHLGLLMPSSKVGADKPPAALWTSPCFEFREENSILHVNARFQMALSPNAKAVREQPLFRLREQLLSDMIYRIHSYGARPGFISFRGSQRSNKDPSAHKASKQQAGGNGSAGPNQ